MGSPGAPLVIESCCYGDYLLLSKTLLAIETTSCYRDCLLLSRLPLVIGTTSCYRDYLLLSRLPLIIGNTSCYRKTFLSDSERHTFEPVPLSVTFFGLCILLIHSSENAKVLEAHAPCINYVQS